MTQEELRKKLLAVEEFEEGYSHWQHFQKVHNWEEASAGERKELWEAYKLETVQSVEKWLSLFTGGRTIVLDYEERVTPDGKKTNAYQEGEQENVFLLSRDLVRTEEGLRQWMMIQKHARFTTCFPHSHSFLEMNYCYSGSFINCVNGKAIRMKEGDILLMEPGCVHYIETPAAEDILLNIVWFPSAMLEVLEKIIPGECELSCFLTDSFVREPGKMNYLFLETGRDREIPRNMNEIMAEYYDSGRVAAEELLIHLLRTLFARLWRFSEENVSLVHYGYRPASKVAQMITYIKKHCVQCTRESVAAHFGYSGSRVSNLLTEHFGRSFVTLRNEFRLEKIEEQLEATDLPVQRIAEAYGFHNQTQFYRLYKEYFGHLPRQKN